MNGSEVSNSCTDNYFFWLNGVILQVKINFSKGEEAC